LSMPEEGKLGIRSRCANWSYFDESF
jgi:hypothetical protein